LIKFVTFAAKLKLLTSTISLTIFPKKIRIIKKIKKSNIAKELKDLKKLYNDGTLSKEEFTKAKSKLLN